MSGVEPTQPAQPMQPMQPARPPGPSLRLAILLVIAGVAVAIPTFIAGVVPIARAVTDPQRFEAPSTVRIHLGKGDYMVYQASGSNSLGAAFSTNDNVSISPADVTVTASDGTNIETSPRSSLRETLAVNGVRYVGAVRFTTPAAGDYMVAVRNSTPTSVLVARPFGETIKSVLGWFALTGIGGLAAIVGVVLLIVGSVRRNRMRSAFAYGGPPPAGWHPDPWGSGRLRYWDGTRWTEHMQ